MTQPFFFPAILSGKSLDETVLYFELNGPANAAAGHGLPKSLPVSALVFSRLR